MARAVRLLPDPITFAGVTIRVSAEFDDVEFARRERVQPAERVSREVLEALFVLPEDAIIAEGSLPVWVVRALRSAPAWVAEHCTDGWRRTYRPPAYVDFIGLANREASIEAQLAELEWLNPVSPRIVIVNSMDRALQGIDAVTASAAGLAIAESADECWILVPPSTSRVRLTAQRWWLAEMVADLRYSVVEPTATPWRSDRG